MSNGIVYSSAIFQVISFPRVIIQQGLTTESAIHAVYMMVYAFGLLFFSSMLADEATFIGSFNSIDLLLQVTKGKTVIAMRGSIQY